MAKPSKLRGGSASCDANPRAAGVEEAPALGVLPASPHEKERTAFDNFHPVVALFYFVSAIALVMLAFHPVVTPLAFAAGFLQSAYLRGFRNALASLGWQLPLVLIIALANPLFSPMGSTELFRIGVRAVYLESLAYGLNMGLLLCSALLWFSNAAHVLTSDKVMSLMGNAAPTVALVLSMAMRLVPRFVARGNAIQSVQDSCAAVRPEGVKQKVSSYARLASVLMGWSMEDSLETADAMRARGWGAHVKRTTYRRDRFRTFDALILATFVAFTAIAGFLAWTACSQFEFYPRMSTLVLWWGYIVVALYLLLPLILQFIESIRWGLR